MAFFRKAGCMLGRSVSSHISQDISFSKPTIFQAVRWMSSPKLFVGGLSWSTDDRSLEEAFNKYGAVVDARVIVDRESGRSRGFGFITYSSVEEASAAIQALDSKELYGRMIKVDYANDRARGYGGGGGYNSGGFGGNYGGGGGYNDNGGYGGSHGNGDYGGSSNYNSRSATSSNGYDDQNFGTSSSGYDGFGDQTNNVAGAAEGGGLGQDGDGSFADRRS
ncbi:hypothetical protein OROMI_003419 [Orobanche minor]